MASREHSLTHPAWDGREADFLPLTSPAASDSANLDMLAEFLVSPTSNTEQGCSLRKESKDEAEQQPCQPFACHTARWP